MAPAKRARLDTDDRYNYPGGAHPSGGYGPRNHHGGGGPGVGGPRGDYGGYHGGHYSGTSSSGNQAGAYAPRDNVPTYNVIDDPNIFLSFKAFLMASPEEMNELDSVKAYNAYKIKSKTVQAKTFFEEHKDEEWFRSKYRPQERSQRDREQRAAWQRRLRTFMDLLDMGWLERVSIDIDRASDIRKFLDAFVIRLQGGSESDLKALEEIDYNKSDILSDMVQLSEEAEKLKRETAMTTTTTTAATSSTATETKQSENQDSMTNGGNGTDESSASAQDEDQGIDCADPAADKDSAMQTETSVSDQQPAMESTDNTDAAQDTNNAANTEANNQTTKTPMVNPHATSSILLRTVHPRATREDVEKAARELAPDHFLRVAFAEPIPPKFYRRAYITYKHLPEKELKDICWKFPSIKFNDHDPIASVYHVPKDNQRIKGVSGLFEHKSVVRADIKNVADLIMSFDAKRKIWQPEPKPKVVANANETQETQDSQETRENQSKSSDDGNSQDHAKDSVKDDSESAEAESKMSVEPQTEDNGEVGEEENQSQLKNPLLDNVKDYLIEEANTEEMELVGTQDREEGEADNFHTVRDENLITILDRLILYLRCVHSFDYYSVNEYIEDDMPHPLLYMYARGKKIDTPVSMSDINEIIKQHATKIKRFTEEPILNESEQRQLGKLDIDAAIDKFIDENTIKISDGKYECLLSKKKFKGPEFVRKHILVKQADAVDELRKDIEFFNNYLADPRRPTNEIIATKYVKPHHHHHAQEQDRREPYHEHSSQPQWQRHPRPQYNRRNDHFGGHSDKVDYHHHRVR